MATANGIDRERIPLMLIHGAWLSARSWENFADYFENRGFAVSAPEWPRKDGDVEELREDADELAGLGLDEIVDHYEKLIRALRQPPVLMGHSFGGLIVELLLDRGLGRAAEGHPRAAVLLAEGGRQGARASVEVARRRDADARGVHVRLREHVCAGGRRRSVRALRGSRDGADLLRGRLRQLPDGSADRARLRERRASAAADRRRDRGPHRPGFARREAVQEVRALAGADGLHRVRGPAPPVHGGRRLGRGRCVHRELARGRARRDGEDARRGREAVTPRPSTEGELIQRRRTSLPAQAAK